MERGTLEKIRDNYEELIPDDLNNSKQVIVALQEKQQANNEQANNEQAKNDEASRDAKKEKKIIDTKDEDFEMEGK